MRVYIDEDCLEDGAAAWWRRISPEQRAVLIQALWECGHGTEQQDNPHEEARIASNERDRGTV